RGGAGGLGLGGCFGDLGFGAVGLGTLTGAGGSALIAARSLSGGALVVGLRLGLGLRFGLRRCFGVHFSGGAQTPVGVLTHRDGGGSGDAVVSKGLSGVGHSREVRRLDRCVVGGRCGYRGCSQAQDDAGGGG